MAADDDPASGLGAHLGQGAGATTQTELGLACELLIAPYRSNAARSEHHTSADPDRWQDADDRLDLVGRFTQASPCAAPPEATVCHVTYPTRLPSPTAQPARTTRIRKPQPAGTGFRSRTARHQPRQLSSQWLSSKTSW